MRLREEVDDRAEEKVLSFGDVDLAREDLCLGAVEILGFGFEVPLAESEAEADNLDKVSFFIDNSALEEVDSKKYK